METRILPAVSRNAKIDNEGLRDEIVRLRREWQKEWIYAAKNEKACY
jgi:hypothetical protein